MYGVVQVASRATPPQKRLVSFRSRLQFRSPAARRPEFWRREEPIGARWTLPQARIFAGLIDHRLPQWLGGGGIDHNVLFRRALVVGVLFFGVLDALFVG